MSHGQRFGWVGALAMVAVSALGVQAQVTLETRDGLALVLGADGRPADLRVDGRALPLLKQPGGFFVEDLMAGTAPVLVTGAVTPTGDASVFRGSAPGLAVDVEATFTPAADHVRVDGWLRDATGQDRGLRVSFRLPLDARGWTWWDDIATPRAIVAGQTYAYCGSSWGVGQGRQVSVYPFASVTGQAAGLALAQRVDEPRFFRLSYDADTGYCIEYELGLSAETAKFPSAASFHFLLYRHDPAWGMRAAAQRYYELFPEAFRVRATRQGLYCYGVPADLPHPDDFGFCFDLAGFYRPERRALQDHGLYLMVHPMGTEAQIAWPSGYDWGTADNLPSLAQVEDILLSARPEYGQGPTWHGLSQRYGEGTFEDNRQRVANSAVYGPDGHLRLYPYSDTIEFVATSTDPELPEPNMAQGERRYFIQHDEAVAAAAAARLDGVDFDNIALSAGRTTENFRREHFRWVDHPLIYDAASGRVCIQTGMGFYEFVQQIADEMHAQGRLCTGNLADDPHTQTFFGHLLDKHGGEIAFHAPTRDLRAYRTLAYQKPVSHIVYPGAVAAGQEETVMHRWLAFGEFPAITELAYSDGSDFESGRPLYRRYMPLMQRLALAGWEPVTCARVEGEGLFVERFGRWADGDLHFTVHNDTEARRTGRLIVDRRALGMSGRAVCVELQSSAVADADRDIPVALDPHRTAVLHLFAPDRGTLSWWRGPHRLRVEGGGRVLEGKDVLLRARVEGGARRAPVQVEPPAGWSVVARPHGRWCLQPGPLASEGEAVLTARVAGAATDSILLRQSVRVIPVPALELASARLDVTLGVSCPLRVAVRNNDAHTRQAAVAVALPADLGGPVQGSARVPGGGVATVEMVPATVDGPVGVRRVEVEVDGRRQAVEVHARRGLEVRRLREAPVLDGALDEWSGPPSAPGFEVLGGAQPPGQETTAWLGYDKSALYIAFRCAEDRMADLRVSVRDPDGTVWDDDDVAIFLDPWASRGVYCQIEVNALGTVYDSWNDDRGWSSGARAAAGRAEGAWTLEVAIPWDALGTVPGAGARWGINLGRQEKPHAETSAVAPTFKEAPAFADLIFE